MDESSLSYYDTVCLIAHYHNKANGNKRTTGNDLVNRGYTEEQLKQIQSAETFKPIKTCGITFKSDYSHLDYPYYDYVNNLYNAYEKGMLPFEGCVADQPVQIMQVFLIMGNLISETKEYQRIQQDKANQSRTKKRK